jgi:hypothetical protein
MFLILLIIIAACMIASAVDYYLKPKTKKRPILERFKLYYEEQPIASVRRKVLRARLKASRPEGTSPPKTAQSGSKPLKKRRSKPHREHLIVQD